MILTLALFPMAGCQALAPTPLFLPSDTPTPTLSPTATIQWFPVTTTPTPGAQRASPAPTVDQRPAMGEILLSDNFSDSAAWQTFETTGGTAKIANGRLTLAAPEFAANLVSLRRGPLPDDYYLEISAATSLCRGKDTYGVAFRADGAASQYRLIVSCDGFLRVERWRPADASVLQDWTPSGQIPSSGPQVLRLGVWLVRDEMRFFVNGAYQFGLRDPLLQGQQAGVFLRSTGANAATVSFSDLKVRSISGYVPSPVPSATPVITIYPTRAPTFTPGR